MTRDIARLTTLARWLARSRYPHGREALTVWREYDALRVRVTHGMTVTDAIVLSRSLSRILAGEDA